MAKKRFGLARQKLIGPLVSLTTLFLCIISLELTGYLWEVRTAQGPQGWTFVGARRIRLERHGLSDAPYYKFKANDFYTWEGIPVQINSQGFRGPEFTVEKPTGVYRILNLGDSVAFGWEVGEQETYGRRLEQLLHEQKDGVEYEVINIGIPSLNLELERNLLLQEALKYQPDLVILDVTLANDFYAPGPNLSEKQSLIQWLRDHTYSWPFLTHNIRLLIAKANGKPIGLLTPWTQEYKYYPLDENDKMYDTTFGFIKEMADATRNASADFIIVVFPTVYQLNSLNHSDVPQQALKHRAETMDIEYVDMLPPFRAACEKAGIDECEGYENLLFADVWMHPTRYGHQLAADELAKIILNK